MTGPEKDMGRNLLRGNPENKMETNKLVSYVANVEPCLVGIILFNIKASVLFHW